MKRFVVIVVVWACLINLFGLLALNRLNLAGDTAYTWMDPARVQPKTWDIVSIHARWDSEWYLDIIRNGYVYRGPGQLANMVFFPVYPTLVKILGVVLAGQYVLAGWIVSLAALVAATYLLHRLVKEFHPRVDADLAVFLLLIFPTAFFFNAVYTESLFLAFSLACFLYAFRRQFWIAGLFGLAASLTRVTGAFLALPLLVEFVRAYQWRGLLTPKVLSVALPGFGLLSFFAFHAWKFGDPLLFFKVEKTWGRTLAVNADHFQILTPAALGNLVLDISFLCFAIIMMIMAFRRFRASYGVYILSTILVIVTTGSLMSLNRYVSVLFPAFIIGASLKSAYARVTWIAVSCLLLGLYTTLFVHGHWAG